MTVVACLRVLGKDTGKRQTTSLSYNCPASHFSLLPFLCPYTSPAPPFLLSLKPHFFISPYKLQLHSLKVLNNVTNCSFPADTTDCYCPIGLHFLSGPHLLHMLVLWSFPLTAPLQLHNKRSVKHTHATSRPIFSLLLQLVIFISMRSQNSSAGSSPL